MGLVCMICMEMYGNGHLIGTVVPIQTVGTWCESGSGSVNRGGSWSHGSLNLRSSVHVQILRQAATSISFSDFHS